MKVLRNSETLRSQDSKQRSIHLWLIWWINLKRQSIFWTSADHLQQPTWKEEQYRHRTALRQVKHSPSLQNRLWVNQDFTVEEKRLVVKSVIVYIHSNLQCCMTQNEYFGRITQTEIYLKISLLHFNAKKMHPSIKVIHMAPEG